MEGRMKGKGLSKERESEGFPVERSILVIVLIFSHRFLDTNALGYLITTY